MRYAAWLVALFSIVLGIVGFVAPDSVMAIRREYLSTPVGLFAAGAVRLAMGLVLILAASRSRAPRVLRVIGALMCLQGLAPLVIGTPDRAQAILEWEASQGHTVLRVGAAVALATGTLVMFAVTGDRSAIRREDWPRG
jgi:hypothetical protein